MTQHYNLHKSTILHTGRPLDTAPMTLRRLNDGAKHRLQILYHSYRTMYTPGHDNARVSHEILGNIDTVHYWYTITRLSLPDWISILLGLELDIDRGLEEKRLCE